MISSVVIVALFSFTNPQAPDLVLRAATVHVGNGTTYSPGYVVLGGGKVLAVGGADLALPAAVQLRDLGEAVITPGFVEGASYLGLPRGARENEEGRESTASYRASHVLDPRSSKISNSLRVGVTSAVVHPGASNVIGGLSCWATRAW
jgi:imidazolonepropionase-like amidohydrolase